MKKTYFLFKGLLMFSLILSFSTMQAQTDGKTKEDGTKPTTTVRSTGISETAGSNVSKKLAKVAKAASTNTQASQRLGADGKSVKITVVGIQALTEQEIRDLIEKLEAKILLNPGEQKFEDELQRLKDLLP